MWWSVDDEALELNCIYKLYGKSSEVNMNYAVNISTKTNEANLFAQ